ncbi:MAG: hypothetical protein HUK16_08865, partial [Bacteroidales bacterium]|nr:hypothetical protein [Bacteroidales bacterium]
IKESDFRDFFNASVVSVERGKQKFELPKPDFQLFPYDRITFVGNDDHLRNLLGKVEVVDETLIQEHEEGDVEMYRITVGENSPFLGLSLLNSGLSSKYDAMVIAIERNGDFILNPSARIVFEVGDLIWFVAESDKAEALMKV